LAGEYYESIVVTTIGILGGVFLLIGYYIIPLLNNIFTIFFGLVSLVLGVLMIWIVNSSRNAKMNLPRGFRKNYGKEDRMSKR
jgi:TctA family transporter